MIVALAGSLGGASLNLVIPPLISLRLRGYALGAHMVFLHVVIIAFGVSISLIGTGLAVNNIWDAYLGS
ncbi:unnamed protein product [Chrysoparadoxa australica]